MPSWGQATALHGAVTDSKLKLLKGCSFLNAVGVLILLWPPSIRLYMDLQTVRYW